MTTAARLMTVLFLTASLLGFAFAEDSPTTPVARTDSLGQSQCQEINADLAKLGTNIDLAFVGDSITRRWRGEGNKEVWSKYWGSYRAVNMGIGGDQTQNVLWRLQNGQLDGYQARVFVVMIGTNNCWGRKTVPEDVAAGIKSIIDLIQTKQPKTKILLLSILPVGEKPNPGRKSREAINALISTFSGGPVDYMDISTKFLEPDGTISKDVMPDYLHLAPKGYEIWSEAIQDKVKELLAETERL
ncbi:MAG: GDSL-type esterase/lipase family protein [Planctomycetaceae bacterium]